MVRAGIRHAIIAERRQGVALSNLSASMHPTVRFRKRRTSTVAGLNDWLWVEC